MKYLGSKRGKALPLLEVMLPYRGDRTWVEPFVGGGNMIDKVIGNRIGSDLDVYAIEALKLIRDNPESLSDLITEDFYKDVKNNRDKYPIGLVGYVAYNMSFAAKFFGGYARSSKGVKSEKDAISRSTSSKNSALKQSPLLKDVELICSSYENLMIPPNSIIYCDPPYRDTAKYRHKFDHDKFYQWCRNKVNEGHIVFVSEYSAPEDFECVWEQEVTCGLDSNNVGKRIEKLFRVKSTHRGD